MRYTLIKNEIDIYINAFTDSMTLFMFKMMGIINPDLHSLRKTSGRTTSTPSLYIR